MNRKLIFLIFLIFASSLSRGQGCSDAGACSVDILDFNSDEKKQTRKVTLSFDQSFGLGEKFIFIAQSTLGVQYKITPSTRTELRVPYIFTYGNLGYTYGVGDLILSLSQDFFRDKNYQLTGIVGSRIKTNNADLSFDEQPLPMAYQTSLGTYDIIAGLQYARMKWNFYFAYQHPFGRNENEYLVPENETDPNKQYYESAYLKRGDDLYARARYNLKLKSPGSFIFTLLAIYRLQKSEIIKNDVNTVLDGSQGVTLNLGATYSKPIKNGRQLSFQLAFPVIDRDYRADGLTRNLVISVRISNL
ncbi:MAG: hypothetical protein DRI88_01910 [Bacteroidetes bacterium]|nr:MAG: hypothetical protein DRI88_01910 [Bacteroidota bacterium]RLD73570.1 MAG: hypothetical protein DRI87_03580 [Bacteroidota bacterium]